MIKPSWKDAPPWARYLARDDRGWVWFEHKPQLRESWDGVSIDHPGQPRWRALSGLEMVVDPHEDTLEERPQ